MARPSITHEEFVSRLPNGYYLRYETYTDSRKKYDVVCPKHPNNVWTPWGSSLLSGKASCPACSAEKQSKDRRLTHEDVVSLFEEDGRGFTIRDGSKYTTNKDGVSVVCHKHPEYEWHTRPLDVIYNQKNCPVCIGQVKLTDGIIDDRLKGKSIERISTYGGKSRDTVKFRCLVDGYEWTARPSRVTTGECGCPMCAGNVKWDNERTDEWLHTNVPNMIRVSDISSVHQPTKFKCADCGYVWSAQFGNVMRNNHRCPSCSQTKRWNDELIDRWLVDNKKTFERISSYASENVTIRWKCFIDGVEWETRLNAMLQGQECPQCTGGGGFKVTEPGYLYYGKVSVGSDTFHKIGISNRDPIVRLKETRHETELLWLKSFSVGIDARKVEQSILQQFKHLIQTEHTFSGSTECFTEDIRKYVDLDKFVCNNTQIEQKEPT